MQDFLSQADCAEKVPEYLEQVVLEDLEEAYGNDISFTGCNLVRALSKIYAKLGDSFVFIIDEWDCIFREKKNALEVQTKYLDFLRVLFKDKPYVKLSYMTGILPIKKYGTHSALNMFTEFSMTEPKQLAEYIGFTEAEVKHLCEAYNMDFDETKRWYDGYRITDALHIYNPKSVVDAMLNQEFHSYWVNTETYEALKVYIEMNYDGLQDTIVQLLAGACHTIETRNFSNDMTTFADQDDVLTLLVHLGYLAYHVQKKEVSIPNEEIRAEFVNAIKGSGWQEVIQTIKRSQELLEHTWAMNEEEEKHYCKALEQYTGDILLVGINYETGNKHHQCMMEKAIK